MLASVLAGPHFVVVADMMTPATTGPSLCGR